MQYEYLYDYSNTQMIWSHIHMTFIYDANIGQSYMMHIYDYMTACIWSHIWLSYMIHIYYDTDTHHIIWYTYMITSIWLQVYKTHIWYTYMIASIWLQVYYTHIWYTYMICYRIIYDTHIWFSYRIIYVSFSYMTKRDDPFWIIYVLICVCFADIWFARIWSKTRIWRSYMCIQTYDCHIWSSFPLRWLI